MTLLLAEVTRQQSMAKYAFVFIGIPLLLRLGRWLKFNWSLYRTGMFRAYWFDS